jgi:hypothetical protein
MKIVRVPGLVIVALAALSLMGCSMEGSGPATPPPTAEETVEWVAAGLAENDPTVVWDALPASYQQDVSSILHEFAGKVDAEVWDRSVSVLRKTTGVLRNKKDFLLNGSVLPDDLKSDDVTANWDPMVGFLDSLVHSELSEMDTLMTLDVREFLAGSGSELMAEGQTLTALSPDEMEDVGWNKLSELTATKVGEESGVVTVRIEIPDEEPEELAFVQVEERWIPKDMADEWPDDMAELREGLAEMGSDSSGQSSTQITMMLSMLEGLLDQLDAADTQEQFDTTLKEGFGPLLFGAMMMGSAQDQPVTE